MTIKLKKFLQNLAFKFGFIINRIPNNAQLKTFLSNFRDSYVSVNLQRIGGEGDGGYLVPDILSTIEYCFSPGVDVTADFELELSQKYSIKSFMADASVKSAPINDKNFTFIEKFLGSKTQDRYITLSDWIDLSAVDEDSNKILQMDIEGGEYDVLTESSETLSNFSILIIEFHGLQNMFDTNFLKMISAIFEKIYKNFSICHVHPNTCSGIASLNGIDVPRVIEVTFINKKFIKDCSKNEEILLPHPLDSSNLNKISEIIMPEIWWKK